MNSLFRHRGALRHIAVALVVAMTTSQAYAQETRPLDTPTNEARAHFDRGVTFYEETDYTAALVEFRRAYALAPTWQVLFNIGQSYFQLRNYAHALVTLRRFVDEGGDRVPPERRAVVDAETADLANRVGHARITSNTAGATITIDDEAVGVTPVKEPVLVSVGVRKVKAVHPDSPSGVQPIETEVSVPAGETVDVRLDFPESAGPAIGASPAPPPTSKSLDAPERVPTGGRNHVPAFMSIGVAAAGVAVGAVFGGLTLRDKSRLDGECAGKACGIGSRPDIDAVSRDGTISTVGFAVAAASLAAGVVFWLAAGGSNAHGAVVATPAAARAGLGPGFLAGTF